MSEREPFYTFDLTDRHGPYWGTFQEFLRQSDMGHTGDYVPIWFLVKLCQERLMTAVACIDEYGQVSATVPGYARMVETKAALEHLLTLLDDIGGPDDPLCVGENTLHALLGAQEVANARAALTRKE